MNEAHKLADAAQRGSIRIAVHQKNVLSLPRHTKAEDCLQNVRRLDQVRSAVLPNVTNI